MRSITLAAVAVMVLGATALGQSSITYHLYVDGDNQEGGWSPVTWPAFDITGSTKTPPAAYDISADPADWLTWEVRVVVAGMHDDAPDGPGNGLYTNGATNLVFDLDLLALPGTDLCADDPVNLGSSTVIYTSTMNDGTIPAGFRPLQRAAFCVAFDADHPDDLFENWPPYYSDETTEVGYPYGVGGVQQSRAFDPMTSGGPKMDRIQYPSTSYHDPNEDDPASYPLATYPSVLPGRLAGMGCGYKEFFFANGYVAGVGIYPYGDEGATVNCARGLNASDGTPIFEGQISTENLPAGTYALRLTPGVGNNVMRGDIFCRDQFVPAGHFAVAANSVSVDNNTCTPDAETGIAAGYLVFEVGGGIVPVTVDSWVSRKTHAGATVQDLDITLAHEDAATPPPYEVCGTSEPRLGGVQTVVVTLGGDALGLVDGTITAVHMAGATPGDVNADTAVLSDGNTKLTLTFSGLADVQCYQIDLAGELTAGTVGDTDCRFVNLYGDEDGDFNVTLTDALNIKDDNGLPPADHARSDIDLDNNITLTDALNAKDENGKAVTCPGCS